MDKVNMKLRVVAAGIMLLILSTGCIEETLDRVIGEGEELVCDNIDPSSVNEGWDRSHCYKDAADRKNTPETCAKITESAPKSKCYLELAEELGEPKLCENLVNHPPSGSGDYSRLECLHKAAVAIGQQSVCEKMGTDSYGGFIGPAYNKEECIKAVNSTLPRHPEKAGFDPTDTDAANGGAF